MTRSSRPGASGRPCATRPGSSRGSTGSSSTPAGTGCGRPRWLATDISAEVALATGDHAGPRRGPRRHRRRHRGAVARSPGRRRAALLPRPDRRRHRDAGSASREDGPVPPPLRTEAAARRDRCGRDQGDHPMTDRELEAAAPRLVRGRGRRRPRRRPADLRESLATIPATTPAPSAHAVGPTRLHAARRRRPDRGRRRLGRRFRVPARDAGGHAGAVPGRHRTGLAVADGDRARDAVTDREPRTTGPRSPSCATSNKARDLSSGSRPLPDAAAVDRRTDGHGAHELLADGVGSQTLLAWSPDGTRLLYSDETSCS